MRVTITLRAPLAHGSFGDGAGNATLIRRMAIVSLPGMPQVPVVSGNALRGVLRREVMRDLFRAAGASRETIPSPEWDRLYAALANGGHMTEGAETRTAPAELRALRSACPPLSVFGAALYNHLLPGHMDVGILWPRCAETVAAGLCSVNSGPGEQPPPAEDLVREVSHVRHVDRDQQDPDVSGVTPMPTTVETLSTGAVLETEIAFKHSDPAAHQETVILEIGAVLHGLGLVRTLGGQSSRGLGVVSIEHDGVSLYADEYRGWRDEHAAEAIAAVRAHIERPGPTKKGRKAA